MAWGPDRLVDVKFHALNSEFFGTATEEDQEYDFYHWSAILGSVSAFEVYRKVVVLEMQHSNGSGHLGPSCSPRSDSTTSLNSAEMLRFYLAHLPSAP